MPKLNGFFFFINVLLSHSDHERTVPFSRDRPAEVTTAHSLHSPGFFYQRSHELAQTDGSVGAEKKAGVGAGKFLLLWVPSLPQVTKC